MPLLDDTLETRALPGSTYGYSATRLQALGATEYTLVAIAADQSGSVRPFKAGIEECIARIVRTCAHAPRADNVMLRLVAFDDDLVEVHGFKPIPACDPAAYRGCLAAGGATALYDAFHNAVGSVLDYGRTLRASGCLVNGLVFVVTDGLDNDSAVGPDAVKAALALAIRTERIRDVKSVLVGVNVADGEAGPALMAFSAAAGFDGYLEIDRADEAGLAKLAAFTSRSIAVASTMLGALTF